VDMETITKTLPPVALAIIKSLKAAEKRAWEHKVWLQENGASDRSIDKAKAEWLGYTMATYHAEGAAGLHDSQEVQ